MHGSAPASDYDPRISVGGSGPPVVLVPGMDGTGLLFYRQVPLLARRHRVATYALRSNASSMDALVDDLGGVIDVAAGPGGRAIVIGESFGGALALSLGLARPDRVEALVVLNSFPYFAPRFRLRLARFGLGLLPWGMMPLVRRLTAFRLHSPHTHRAEIRRFMEVTAGASRAGYLNRLTLLTQYDVRRRLSTMRVPVLFVASDRDHLVPAVEQARAMALCVPGSTVHVLEGHGHICLIAPGVDLDAILRSWCPAGAFR